MFDEVVHRPQQGPEERHEKVEVGQDRTGARQYRTQGVDACERSG